MDDHSPKYGNKSFWPIPIYYNLGSSPKLTGVNHECSNIHTLLLHIYNIYIIIYMLSLSNNSGQWTPKIYQLLVGFSKGLPRWPYGWWVGSCQDQHLMTSHGALRRLKCQQPSANIVPGRNIHRTRMAQLHFWRFLNLQFKPLSRHSDAKYAKNQN